MNMFTSLRARLWLSYAIVITIALGIVTIVLFTFLIRNPLLTRQTQQKLRTAQSLILANPQEILNDDNSLERITQAQNVRVLVFDSARELAFDSNPDDPQLPSPRRNVLGRNSQTALDSAGTTWLYATTRLPDGRFLIVAAPRPPKVPILNIFADEFYSRLSKAG